MHTDTKLVDAVRVLGTYTAWRFDLWILAGNQRASCRAHVMSVLMGQKMPQSKSGVTALRAEFNQRAGITGDCPAHREENFIAFCRELFPEWLSHQPEGYRKYYLKRMQTA